MSVARSRGEMANSGLLVLVLAKQKLQNGAFLINFADDWRETDWKAFYGWLSCIDIAVVEDQDWLDDACWTDDLNNDEEFKLVLLA